MNENRKSKNIADRHQGTIEIVFGERFLFGVYLDKVERLSSCIDIKILNGRPWKKRVNSVYQKSGGITLWIRISQAWITPKHLLFAYEKNCFTHRLSRAWHVRLCVHLMHSERDKS